MLYDVLEISVDNTNDIILHCEKLLWGIPNVVVGTYYLVYGHVRFNDIISWLNFNKKLTIRRSTWSKPCRVSRAVVCVLSTFIHITTTCHDIMEHSSVGNTL